MSKLALVPRDDDDEEDHDYALEFGLYVLGLLNGIAYGYVEIHKHANDLLKVRLVSEIKAPDSLKRSPSARRRELNR